MGQRLGVGGMQNSGKSWGRRYIPDGENAFIIAPSKKTSYLYTGPKDAHKMSAVELDAAVESGKRTLVGEFDLFKTKADGTVLWDSLLTARKNYPGNQPGFIISEAAFLKEMMEKAKTLWIKPQNLKGTVAYCDNLEELNVYLDFVDIMLPWIHTIILPDFTHYISQILTSIEFRNKQFGNEQYKKYLDLAADGLRNFITRADTLRKDLVVITEFHTEFNDASQQWELFVPGGKMIKEKFLPSSYYDTFLFTDVLYGETPEQANEYRYVTRATNKYREARTGDLGLPQPYMPNNLQTVLEALRKKKGIEIKYK